VLTGFGIVDANAALLKAGQLMQGRSQGSQVPLSAHFGGGAAAVPAAPITPRGDGQRVTFTIGFLLSAAVAVVAAVGFFRNRAPARRGHP
jgi:hypothetical protein